MIFCHLMINYIFCHFVINDTFCHYMINDTFCHFMVNDTFCHFMVNDTFCHYMIKDILSFYDKWHISSFCDKWHILLFHDKWDILLFHDEWHIYIDTDSATDESQVSVIHFPSFQHLQAYLHTEAVWRPESGATPASPIYLISALTSSCVRYCRNTSTGAKSSSWKSLMQGVVWLRNDDSTQPNPTTQLFCGSSDGGTSRLQSGVTDSLNKKVKQKGKLTRKWRDLRKKVHTNTNTRKLDIFRQSEMTFSIRRE